MKKIYKLFRFLDRFSLSEKKNTWKLRVVSGIQLIPVIKSADHYIAVGVIRDLWLHRES